MTSVSARQLKALTDFGVVNTFDRVELPAHVPSFRHRVAATPRRAGPQIHDRQDTRTISTYASTESAIQKSDAGVAARQRRARVAVTATFFIHGLLFASWTAHIPHIERAIGANNASLGTALLGAPLGSVLAMLVVGKLLERFGSRRVVRVALVGYCLAGALVGLAHGVIGLLAALTVWGLFQGALDVAMNAHATEVEEQAGCSIMSGFHGFWSMGTLLGALIGAGLVGAGVGLFAQLLPIGGLIALLSLPLGRWLLPSITIEHPESAPTPRGRLLSARLVLLGLVAFASMLCEGATADWSAVHLRTDLSASATTAGFAYVAYSLVMVVTRLTAPRVFTLVPPGRAIPVLAAVAAVGMTLGLLSQTVVGTIAGFAVLGLGIATIVPTAFSAAASIEGVPAGTAIAAVSALGWAGFVCGPPLIGHLSEQIGLTTALGLLPMLIGLVATIVALGRLFSSPEA